MSAEANKRIIEDVIDLINRQHRVREAFDRYVGEEYIQHNPGLPNGREAAIALIESHVSSPGFRGSVKRMIAEGDFVVTHMHLQVDENDPGLAIADIWRLKNGKIVEHWDVTQPVPPTSVSGNPMV